MAFGYRVGEGGMTIYRGMDRGIKVNKQIKNEPLSDVQDGNIIALSIDSNRPKIFYQSQDRLLVRRKN